MKYKKEQEIFCTLILKGNYVNYSKLFHFGCFSYIGWAEKIEKKNF